MHLMFSALLNFLTIEFIIAILVQFLCDSSLENTIAEENSSFTSGYCWKVIATLCFCIYWKENGKNVLKTKQQKLFMDKSGETATRVEGTLERIASNSAENRIQEKQQEKARLKLWMNTEMKGGRLTRS